MGVTIDGSVSSGEGDKVEESGAPVVSGVTINEAPKSDV
jgi:hypothetical protein